MAPPSTSSRPSPFHRAFALALAKTKPTSLSVREYLTKIRQHLTQDHNPIQDLGSRARYLDAAAYWQSMSQQSQREIDHLQTRCALLEREKAKLESQKSVLRNEPVVKDEEVQQLEEGVNVPTRPSTAQPKSSGSRRRKMPFKDDMQVQRKRVNVGRGTADAPIVVVDEMARFEDRELEAGVTRHLLCIHKLYQDISPDCTALSYHLIEATKGIVQHIAKQAVDIQERLQQASQILDKTIRKQRTAAVLATLNNEFRKSQRAAARSFISLFHGLETLWEKGIESGKRNHGVVSYEMICGFRTMMETITSTCEMHAKMSMAEEETSSVTRPATTETSKQRKAKRVERAPVPQEVTTLLLAILSGLTVQEKGPHSAFFEGCLYFILERVGKALYLVTFKHFPLATIEEEIAQDDANEGLDAVTNKAVNLEVQFLALLMDRAMSLAPGFLGCLTSTNTRPKSGRPSTATKSTSTAQKSSLGIVAKEKLQHTLVRCMFGDFPKRVHTGDSDTEDEGESGINNSEFVDVLRRPTKMGNLPLPPRVEDSEIPDWFRDEMWRLLGWEILSREDGW